MNKDLHWLMAASLSVTLGGCGLLSPTSSPFTADGASALDIPTPAYEPDTGAAHMGLSGPELSKYNRNYVVGKYFMESDALCSEYLQGLTRVQRQYSLIFGSLATLLGGAGAAFTHASVVRPLSAAAGIASGERAEIDADTFVKQTAQVVIAAIKNSRARTYNNIVQVDFAKSIVDWPLTVALADVRDYHSRCSLNEGITEASASINAVAPQANITPGNTTAAGRSESPPSLSTGGAITGASVGANAAGASSQAALGAARGAAAGASASTAANGAAAPAAAGAAGAAGGSVLGIVETPAARWLQIYLAAAGQSPEAQARRRLAVVATARDLGFGSVDPTTFATRGDPGQIEAVARKLGYGAVR